jgi:hypothetical protein
MNEMSLFAVIATLDVLAGLATIVSVARAADSGGEYKWEALEVNRPEIIGSSMVIQFKLL